MTNFDQSTAIEALGEGRYRAELDDQWRVGNAVNGGYLMAIVGRALAAEVPTKPHTLVLNTHFVAASAPGPAEVGVRVVREGGSFATAAVEVTQGQQTTMTVLATLGDLARHRDDVRTTAVPFEIPPVEECIDNSHAPADLQKFAPLMRRFEMRFHPARIGWAVGEPDHSGELSVWFRLPDREPDPLSLLLALDAMPPALFSYGVMGWAPTLELTAHVRAEPAPGWLRLRHFTRNIAGGLFEEDCEVWDAADRLVAQSRQLAVIPRPRAAS